MKSIIWLFVTISVAYAHEIEGDNQIGRNSSIHLECFDVFIPLINRLSNEAKEASANCVNTATAEKERELTAIKHTRSEIVSEVKRIKETLSHCSSRSDHLSYFECLNGIIEVDNKIVGDIASKSSMFSNKLNKIEEQEIKCFGNSVAKVKDKISNGINNLQYCLMSEDTRTKSGERSEHDFRHSVTDSPGGIPTPPSLPNFFFHTTTTPDPPLEDYDYNSY